MPGPSCVGAWPPALAPSAVPPCGLLRPFLASACWPSGGARALPWKDIDIEGPTEKAGGGRGGAPPLDWPPNPICLWRVRSFGGPGGAHALAGVRTERLDRGHGGGANRRKDQAATCVLRRSPELKAAREGSPGFGSLVLPRRRSVLRLPLCFSVLGNHKAAIARKSESRKSESRKLESRKVENSEIQIVEARCRKLQSGYSRKVEKVGKLP